MSLSRLWIINYQTCDLLARTCRKKGRLVGTSEVKQIMDKIKEKICRSCRRNKPVDDFYENKFSPDGRYAFCKICFDQFAAKLKERERSAAPLNKICEKCGKTRLIEEFEHQPDNSGAQDRWCKGCRQQFNELKPRKSEKEMKPAPQTSKPQAPKPVQPPVQQTTPIPAPESADHEAINPELLQAPHRAQEPEDDFDFIEFLLESHDLEKKTALEKLQIPKQIIKIKARKRVCNGCGKTEDIDQVEKNTVIPVHAWFCDYCSEREAKRLVRKGIIVQDYWGREFKVKKIISSNLVMGVLKNKDGKWGKRTLQIYGSWNTLKD